MAFGCGYCLLLWFIVINIFYLMMQRVTQPVFISDDKNEDDILNEVPYHKSKIF